MITIFYTHVHSHPMHKSNSTVEWNQFEVNQIYVHILVQNRTRSTSQHWHYFNHINLGATGHLSLDIKSDFVMKKSNGLSHTHSNIIFIYMPLGLT